MSYKIIKLIKINFIEDVYISLKHIIGDDNYEHLTQSLY